jgi:lantibiotic modifying enzyme
VGLALLGIQVGGDMSLGTRGALDSAMLPYDFLCCGNFGVLDFLIEAGGRGSPVLLDIARRRALWLSTRAAAGGGYTLVIDEQEPGFFRGLAGIGHVLLRAIAPERVASALAFSPPRTGQGG